MGCEAHLLFLSHEELVCETSAEIESRRVDTDRNVFNQRREQLLREHNTVVGEKANIGVSADETASRVRNEFERVEFALEAYNRASDAEKRDLIKLLTSNRVVTGNNVAVTPLIPFDRLLDRERFHDSGPWRIRTAHLLIANEAFYQMN